MVGRISEAESQDTLDGLPDTKRSGRGARRQWIAAVIASLGMWSSGSTLGWSAPSVPELEDGVDIDGLTKNEVSWVASLVMLAALPGSFLGGYLSDRIGRRLMCIIAVLPFTLGWGLIAGAQNAWMLIGGRILTGMSAGIYSVTSAVFCAELAEDRLRSKLVAWNVVALCLGILYTYILGAVVNWRINSIISGATPLLHLAGMIFMWETPRFLVTKGKLEQAFKSLQWYRGAKTEADVQEEFQKIVSHVNESNSSVENNSGISSEKFFVASTIKPVLISVACNVFQQLSGTTAVTFYTVDIFEAAGSDIQPNLATIIIGATQALATAMAGLLMTKFGRKPLFFFSEVGMCCSLAVLGAFYYFKENDPEKVTSLGWLPLVTLVSYTITYCCGAGILPWTLMADLCPPHAKGITSAMCIATSFCLAFLVAYFFPGLLENIKGYGAFWLFSGICAVGAAFMALVLPETKDKTMDEILNLFKKQNSNSI